MVLVDYYHLDDHDIDAHDDDQDAHDDDDDDNDDVDDVDEDDYDDEDDNSPVRDKRTRQQNVETGTTARDADYHH